MLLSNQKRSGGGAITSCDFVRRKEGLVKVVYEDPEGNKQVNWLLLYFVVAEIVYSRHCSHKSLYLNDKSLEIELELPWLTDQHDRHRVRVSGLTEELDPEKLRFYLSALSNNSVTQMSFNKEQTRAIAEFEETLAQVPLPECSLKIQQEPKPNQLIATGSLTKDGIELPLENLLRGEFNRDVDIVAEQLTGHSDKWLITTSPDVLEFVIRHKDRIPRCETLSIHSDFLGPEATCGVQKKSDELSNFVADNLLLNFLQNPSLPGHKSWKSFLCKHGISLAPKGVITSNLTSNKQKNREVLKKWRKRRQLIDDFIRSNVSVYYTQTLTQQVFNKLKPGFKNLFSKKEVVTKVVEGEPIGIAGMKGNVEQLTQELTKAIAKYEAEIRDEKATKTEVLPNVLDYQLNFLKQTDFFTTLQQNTS
ncbi:hypothetical protein EB796_011094 [Bugula neritina]|uniref:Uncharacterized protein n=1 Tax=Bugula neritina TaxID=10212 RepID=A0A7J7JXA4_BUGNE|nr:hypothetical protein EB796_011094 [Bugula neritina]